jgi:hypothetical protein
VTSSQYDTDQILIIVNITRVTLQYSPLV